MWERIRLHSLSELPYFAGQITLYQRFESDFELLSNSIYIIELNFSD